MHRLRLLTHVLVPLGLAALCVGCASPGTINTSGNQPNLPTVPIPTFSLATGLYNSAQTVTIGESLSGTTIYYTTDGTIPTTSSTVYTGTAIPLPLGTNIVLQAIATKTSYNNSAVALAAYTIVQSAALEPTFSPLPGTYATGQTVTISDATIGASIYYTTDGTTPTASSSKYIAPLSVTTNETIKAIAVASGDATSAVAVATYTVMSAAATPTFSPVGGSYSSSQTVTISSTTPNAIIYYTTNGSVPTTTTGTVYSAPITVSSTETIEAIATLLGDNNSAVASATYTIGSGGSSSTPGTWTWMGGASSIPSGKSGVAGVYGTQGTAAAANFPGGRVYADSFNGWESGNNTLYLFGGDGEDTNGNIGALNDFWVYSVPNNQWTWLTGSNTGNNNGVYGTEHTPATTDTPGGRYGASYWTDATGNFWMFGGQGYPATGNANYLNDLWLYGINNKEWVWAGGSTTINATGVYGTLGQASSNNVPGARAFATTWSDIHGNLWLFGGCSQNGALNDLWVFANNQWTWLSGAAGTYAAGTYGTQGQSSSTTTPGARCAAASWTDNNGNLWLFGGDGYGGTTSAYGNLNDLWEYNTTTKQWTWVSGATTTSTAGVYGTLNTPSASNLPGARQEAAGWEDYSGNFWLFGGLGSDAANTNGGMANLNDLWEFNTTTQQWTWMSGSSTGNAAGVYGTRGTAAAANVPGARISPQVWVDSNNNFWIFGGSYYSLTPPTLYYNDLWRYQP